MGEGRRKRRGGNGGGKGVGERREEGKQWFSKKLIMNMIMKIATNIGQVYSISMLFNLLLSGQAG